MENTEKNDDYTGLDVIFDTFLKGRVVQMPSTQPDKYRSIYTLDGDDHPYTWLGYEDLRGNKRLTDIGEEAKKLIQLGGIHDLTKEVLRRSCESRHDALKAGVEAEVFDKDMSSRVPMLLANTSIEIFNADVKSRIVKLLTKQDS